ncbi:MAG: hypothetical protein K6T83_03330 [Alicyclobacillus sp.]|nr:hypothetical protein [Alicyclobacillus sp.]
MIEQFSFERNDSTAGAFGMMLGNLVGDIVDEKYIEKVARIVDKVSGQLPYTDPTVTTMQDSRDSFDNALAGIMKKLPAPGTTPMY